MWVILPGEGRKSKVEDTHLLLYQCASNTPSRRSICYLSMSGLYFHSSRRSKVESRRYRYLYSVNLLVIPPIKSRKWKVLYYINVWVIPLVKGRKLKVEDTGLVLHQWLKYISSRRFVKVESTEVFMLYVQHCFSFKISFKSAQNTHKTWQTVF